MDNFFSDVRQHWLSNSGTDARRGNKTSSLAISQHRVYLTASTKHMSFRLSEGTLQATMWHICSVQLEAHLLHKIVEPPCV